MIKSGLVFSFCTLIIFMAIYILSIRLARTHPPNLRTIPALEAFREVVGRAVEQGKPIFYSCGINRLTGDVAAQDMAGLSLLRYTSNMAAELGAELYFICNMPAVVAIAEDMLKTAYKEKYHSGQIIYIPDQSSMMIHIMGLYERMRPAASFLCGALYWEAINFVEAAARVGAMQIGGTGRLYQIPYVAAMCDYSLLGEELLAAGAYVSGDVGQFGTIRAADVIRAMILGLCAILALGSIIGFDITSLFTL